MECQTRTTIGREWHGKAVRLELAKVRMARHAPTKNAKLLWLKRQHMNQVCNPGEASLGNEYS
jgi:hypothetical protein